MTVLIEVILAVVAVLGNHAPAEDDAAASGMMHIAQARLESETGCGSDPVYEPFRTGLFVGAISDCTELSAGFWFSDGSQAEFLISAP